jgi:hypothetical protein
MDKNNKDIRKDIEELEKLIEDVKKQNAEEKKELKKQQKQAQPNVIKINLALDYSNTPLINYVVGFLVNFILFFTIIEGLKLATSDNQFIYLLMALLFTSFEILMKQYLLKRHVKLVIYSSGLIFFLFNIVFIYSADLIIPLNIFSFVNPIYPIVFVAIFQFTRMFIKQIYIYGVKTLNNKLKKRS